MTTNFERRLETLKCVLERQRAKQSTTKNDVIKYMIEKRLSSRQTTHNLIKDLIKEKWLNVEKINSQQHYLTVNESWDYYKMQEELLKSQIQKVWEQFPDLKKNSQVVITSKGITLEKKKKVKSN